MSEPTKIVKEESTYTGNVNAGICFIDKKDDRLKVKKPDGSIIATNLKWGGDELYKIGIKELEESGI